MTFTRKNHGDNHSYYLDGVKIPGVTSIIGVLDKPALVRLVWDGADGEGRGVPSGLYFVETRAEGQVDVLKITLLR